MIERRGFLGIVLALMSSPKMLTPFEVIDKPIVQSPETALLLRRLMRVSTLRESQLLRFRALIGINNGDRVLAAPFTGIGRVNGVLSWESANLEAVKSFVARDMTIVDDQGYVLKTTKFLAAQSLSNRDTLKATYNLAVPPTRRWPEHITLGDCNIDSKTLCPRIDVAQYLVQNCAIA